MSTGENIRQLREKYALSQKQLASIAGVSDKAVSTWEQGIKAPRMSALQKIADHFGLQKSNLIEENGLNRSFETSIPELGDLDFALWGKVLELSDQQKKDVYNFAMFLKNQNPTDIDR